MWRDNGRGQSIQIGAVLLFGALIIALAGYQAFVVPQENEQVEFRHSQAVQNELSDLRNTVVSVPGDTATRSVSITLGTRYPARVLAVNPGPPTGTLRTSETPDETVAASVDNAVATGETGDFWDGTGQSYSTGWLSYRPNYNVYSSAPTTYYGPSVLFNQFRDGTVPLSAQSIVDGDRVSLVALNGSLSTTRTGTTPVDVRPVSASTTTVPVRNSTTGGNMTVRVPTRLSEATWRELLDGEFTDQGGHVLRDRLRTELLPAVGDAEVLVIELERNVTYDLELAKAGVGRGVTDEPEAYLTDVRGNGSSVPEGGTTQLVVEVRDEYNNPVSGVVVEGDANGGALAEGTMTTGSDGRAAFRYTAGADAGGTDYAVNFSYDDPTAVSGTAPEDVQMTVSVRAVASGTDGSGTAPFTVAWLESELNENPDENGDQLYNFSVPDEGNTLDLTSRVENASVGTVEDARVDFAVNDSTVGDVFPGVEETDSAGEASTTLTANDNGLVRVYAVTGGGASDYIDINISGAEIPQPGVVYATTGGSLSTVDTSGVVAESEYGVSGVEAAGPQQLDFAFGSEPEVPYIDGNGDLGIVDLSGNRRTLVDDDTYVPGVNSQRLAVGEVSVATNNDFRTGTGPFVYFINGIGLLTRVDANGNVAPVEDGNNNNIIAQAVAGTGDIDGDGTPELVYVDSNSQFAYLEERNNGKAQTVSLTGSPTLNTPNAVGEPADFDSDGQAEIPYIDGSEDVNYVDDTGTVTTVVSGAGGEVPVGAADRDSDNTPEIVYVDASGTQRLAYADPTDGKVFMTDSSGNEITAKTGTGAS